MKRIFLRSRREAISPLIFTHKFGERRIAIRILTRIVTPNRFGPAGPIDTSVRQRTNSSIGTGPSGFLQHALQIYTRASSSGKRRDKKTRRNRRRSSLGRDGAPRSIKSETADGATSARVTCETHRAREKCCRGHSLAKTSVRERGNASGPREREELIFSTRRTEPPKNIERSTSYSHRPRVRGALRNEENGWNS